MMVDLQDLSRQLFAAADQLWTSSTLRPDQYAQPVLALIALRQMEAKFEKVHAELAPKFKGRLKPTPANYQARGAIFLPEGARFSRLLSMPGTADLGAELNVAMKGIVEGNPELAGALPQGHTPYPIMRSASCCACWRRCRSRGESPGFTAGALKQHI
jgi:type I restriction enzyme M protein